MDIKNNNEEGAVFVNCPECAGQNKISCKKCRGAEIGAFWKNKFLYWGLSLTSADIFQRRSAIFISLIFDFIIGAFCLTGAASLAAWSWFYIEEGKLEKIAGFWQEKNSLLFIFWLSCVWLMLFIYRLNKRIDNEKKIKNKPSAPAKIPDNWEDLIKWNRSFDVSQAFREKTIVLLEKAYFLAKAGKHQNIEPLHLLAAMLSSRKMMILFARLDISGRNLMEKINNCLKNLKNSEEKFYEPRPSAETKEILIKAYIERSKINRIM
jgi:hypothetical protein